MENEDDNMIYGGINEQNGGTPAKLENNEAQDIF